MNILLTGASGMIGSLVLEHCLASDSVDQVFSFVRRASGDSHAKLVEVTKHDFHDWDELDDLPTIDAAIFCLGAYTGAVSTAEFKEITVDYPVSLGSKLQELNPDAKFLLLSGQGADRKGINPMSFARFKGMAENRLSELGFKQFNAFRPAYIYPVAEREEPNLSYVISRRLYPVLKHLGPRVSITSEALAEAIFLCAISEEKQEIFENADILKLLDE